MFFNTILPTTLLVCSLLTSIPTTIAQDINGLPQCAGKCLASSLAADGKSCAPSDFSCLCKNHDFVTSSDSCYTSSCSVEDYKSAQAWGVKTCAAAGVQIAAHGANSAANGINSAANSVTNSLTGGGQKNSTGSTTGPGSSATPTNSSGSGSTTSNTAPVNSNSPPARPNSSVTLSAEMVKFFAIGSALLSSLWML